MQQLRPLINQVVISTVALLNQYNYHFPTVLIDPNWDALYSAMFTAIHSVILLKIQMDSLETVPNPLKNLINSINYSMYRVTLRILTYPNTFTYNAAMWLPLEEALMNLVGSVLNTRIYFEQSM